MNKTIALIIAGTAALSAGVTLAVLAKKNPDKVSELKDCIMDKKDDFIDFVDRFHNDARD